MKTADDKQIKRHRVAGVIATSPKPTKLAATLVAAAISVPFLIIVGVFDLLL